MGRKIISKAIFFRLAIFLGLICTVQVSRSFAQGIESTSSLELAQKITAIIDTSSVNPAFWALTIRDEDGSIIWSLNNELLMRPASNMKLLTTATLLNYLGEDYTLKTRLYGVGRQIGDVWSGDLILVGGGDPSMDKHFFPEDPLTVYKQMAASLKEKGIKRVMGSIIGNDSHFDREVYPRSWDWNDLSFYYAPQLSALSFNSNCINLTVDANGEVGGTPSLSWFPYNTNYISFVNLQKITEIGTEYEEYYKRMPGSNTIRLASTMPVGYIEKEDLTVDEPALFAIDTFKRLLQEEGISVQGGIAMEHITRDYNNEKYLLLAEHTSPTVKELIFHINKDSDNFYTEMMLKEVGSFVLGGQGTTEKGLLAMRSFLSEVGIDTNLVVHSDGSGLSGRGLISTESVSMLLDYMRGNDKFEAYFASLPVAGVDGTLKYRFRNNDTYAKVYAKTGFIGGARALSGYVDCKSGRRLTFSMMTNNFAGPVSQVDRVHEAFLDVLHNQY